MRHSKLVVLFFTLFVMVGFFGLLQGANAQGDEAPVVAFIPFSYSTAVGKDVADNMMMTIARIMSERKTFSPFATSEWLDSVYYTEKAKNIDEIIAKAKKVNVPANFLCEGTMFKSGDQYGIILTLNPLNNEIYTSHYFRYFSSLGSMAKYAGELVIEMEKRATRYKIEENLFDKTIYIEKVTPKLFMKAPISRQGEPLAETPALNINGVDYRNTDHFFNALLAYNLHIFRLFDVSYGGTNNYLINSPNAPNKANYTITIDLIAVEKMSRLNFIVMDEKGNLLFYYDYPFGGLRLDSLNDALRKNAQLIAARLLSDQELKTVGMVTINTVMADSPVFFKDYFLGKGTQQNILLPFGTNKVRIGSSEYLKFVLPFAFSKYMGDEGLLSDELKNVAK